MTDTNNHSALTRDQRLYRKKRAAEVCTACPLPAALGGKPGAPYVDGTFPGGYCERHWRAHQARSREWMRKRARKLREEDCHG